VLDADYNAGLSTAYVAFGVVWLACLAAIAFRSYIVQKMEDWVQDNEKERPVAQQGHQGIVLDR
jgi:hypothetical protein